MVSGMVYVGLAHCIKCFYIVVVLVNNGEDTGKLAVISEIIDHNRVSVLFSQVKPVLINCDRQLLMVHQLALNVNH